MGKRKNKNQDRKKKISLVFDENKRKYEKTTNAYFKINIPLLMRDIIFREFLCGFRKRKLERKKKAQEELQRMLKEEKRRIKQEVILRAFLCLNFIVLTIVGCRV